MIAGPAAIVSIKVHTVRSEDRVMERVSDGLSRLRQAVSRGSQGAVGHLRLVRTHPVRRQGS